LAGFLVGGSYQSSAGWAAGDTTDWAVGVTPDGSVCTACDDPKIHLHELGALLAVGNPLGSAEGGSMHGPLWRLELRPTQRSSWRG
jgi:hypothetical protein